jgi:penicillin-binding protein 1A
VTDFISKLKAMSTRRGGSGSSAGSNGTGAQERRENLSSPPPAVEPAPARPATSRRQSPKGKKPLYQRWWVWVLLGLGATAGGGTVTIVGALQAVEQKLPDTKDVLTFARTGTMTIKGSDGSILQQLGPATRQPLSLDKMPPRLIQAFIASEDEHFYEHQGVDYQAIGRAVARNISAGEVVEGGSTITQQLARMVFLDQERSFERKLREAMLAQKIERNIDKEQILERYLNLVYLGSGAYGVADAAWIYFSKSVNDLTLSEMAMIAGLPPAPSVYSPLVDLDAARERRDLVLERMVKAGYITAAERSQAVTASLELKPSTPRNFYSRFPYFTSYIQQQLPQILTPEQLQAGGLTVETTMNPQWQQLAQDTIQDAIEDYGPGQRFEQAALVAIDPRNGEIKALVGGNDFSESQFNRATQAQRQPGSTFKTLVYTTAIAAGFSPYKPYVDVKLVVDGYEPKNYSEGYRGTISIRDALISSINIVAVKVLIDVGFDPVVEMAKRMGIQSELMPTYSLALGASEVNLLELTSAYGTLATAGNHVQAHGIRRILDRNGSVIYESSYQPERAVDADSAAIMTWMLRGVVSSGTGRRAQIDRPAAGKTGTSERRRDLWFVGYIPQMVTGVWLGNDDSSPTWGASSTAAQVWQNFMGDAVDQMPVAPFPDLPRLSGREGSIEAEPVKPRRMREGAAPNRDDRDEQQEEQPRRRRRRADSPAVEAERSEPRQSAPSRSSEPEYEPPVNDAPAAAPVIKVPDAPAPEPPPPAPAADVPVAPVPEPEPPPPAPEPAPAAEPPLP